MTISKEAIETAIAEYGKDTVSQVVEIVEMSDPDGAWSFFDGMGMDDHVSCLESLMDT